MQGKGKGKEIILRYNGEVIEGEHEAARRDPRKEAKVKKPPSLRPARPTVVEVKYEVRLPISCACVLCSSFLVRLKLYRTATTNKCAGDEPLPVNSESEPPTPFCCTWDYHLV